MQKRISQNEVQIHLLKSQILQLCRDNLTNSPCILLFLYLQKVKSVAQIKARASEHHKEETLSQLRSLSPTPFIHLHPAEGAFPHSQHTARKYTNSVVEKELVEKVCCPVTQTRIRFACVYLTKDFDMFQKKTPLSSVSCKAAALFLPGPGALSCPAAARWCTGRTRCLPGSETSVPGCGGWKSAHWSG